MPLSVINLVNEAHGERLRVEKVVTYANLFTSVWSGVELREWLNFKFGILWTYFDYFGNFLQ